MSEFKNAEIKILGKNWEEKIEIISWLKIIEPQVFWDNRWFFLSLIQRKYF